MWAWVHQAASAFAIAVSSLGKVLLGVEGAHAGDARRVSFHRLEHIPTLHKAPTTPRRLTAARNADEQQAGDIKATGMDKDEARNGTRRFALLLPPGRE